MSDLKPCPFCGRQAIELKAGEMLYGCAMCNVYRTSRNLWNRRADLAPDADTVKYGSQRNPKVDRRDPDEWPKDLRRYKEVTV